MNCRFVARDQPRIIPGRHAEDAHPHAAEANCRGCLPCTEPHCRICGMTHIDGTCAECMAETREALHDIARMCDALPKEVEARGINGEAMMLLGPCADPEARGHLEASVLAGRVPADYLDNADHESHPRFVIGSYDMIWRDALEHDEDERWTFARGVDYLDRQLTYMGSFPHVPFEDFARDLRRCRAHLEAVLHDSPHGDLAGVGCFDCGGDLERKLTTTGLDDHWTCRICKRRYTYAEYNFALRARLEAEQSERIEA